MAARRRLRPRAPDSWHIYKQLPGLVLGFHGCDKSTADAILSGRQDHLKESQNEHDWLGHGRYFWENDPWRALEWACDARDRPALTSKPIKTPAVLGAVIDLGLCCNLLEFDAVAEVRKAHDFIAARYRAAKSPLPENTTGPDRVRRFLDRLVIETVHDLRKLLLLPEYDTIRAPFLEGPRVYDQSGFHEKSHIQLAVLKTECIKGYFRVPQATLTRRPSRSAAAPR